MLHHRLILVFAALPLLAACASDPPTGHHQSYGPSNVMPGMSPATDIGTFQGANGWHAGEPSYRPQALPPGFKVN